MQWRYWPVHVVKYKVAATRASVDGLQIVVSRLRASNLEEVS